ncbi:dTDP-4-dehydrorhamnose 3,5-epimerase family protein [Noviherbaspirillum massiliense]|uniref:dTDP-4-dehydrorhamnose 3,5-epimerase family protein n=1 Tax=Noviherbaspirillum massiliense TaxID=1465823 RepID=UPI000315F058|nr:dTDP-4-dehydrorhamnose 3,5-epimerase family protein [Noviherbaspirillum massiliense]
MKFTECEVTGARVVDPAPHQDARGRFMRAWCSRELADAGIDFVPLQANMGYSVRAGTIRGLHYQSDAAPEAKLVRCTRGAVFDVVVDLRPSSPTYLSWFGIELSADNGRMLYVPEGCAHGCQSLLDDTEILYMTSAFYAPDAVRGARFDDPVIGIRWPMPPTLVSAQDRQWPLIERNIETGVTP